MNAKPIKLRLLFEQEDQESKWIACDFTYLTERIDMKHFMLWMVVALMSSCIPDSIKEQMNEGMQQAQQMMADQQFKNAIAQIELHKLRNGNYPASLSELKFLTMMDSSMFAFVEYTSLDSVYELNLKMEFPSFNSGAMEKVELSYPPEFWRGLGCVKSNVK